MILTNPRPSFESEISELEFDELYKPIPGPDGSDWRQHYEIPKDTPVANVWTVIEGDDGKEYISPGYHIVNYVARVVTKIPWANELLLVRVD